MTSVSVVVPVFNSAETLRELVVQVSDAVAPRASALEVILVDDGSTDGSWEVIESICCTTRTVRGVNLARNFGEQSAVLCGIRAARHDVIVTIDDDLQQPPSEIPALLEALVADVDVVYGVPRRYAYGPGRRVATVGTKVLLERVLGLPSATAVTSFRAFRSELSWVFDEVSGPVFAIDGLLASVTDRLVRVPVRHDARRFGRSRYSFSKLVAHTIDLVVGSPVSPMWLVWWVGSICWIGAVATAATVSVSAVWRGEWSDLRWLGPAAVGLLVGVLLFAVALVGEYVVRILADSSGRRPYVVRRTTEHE